MSFVYWFIFWFVSMSFVEHFAHRHVMHRRSVLDRWFPDIYKVHTLLHHLIWNLIHEEMHDPKGRFFSDWPVYKYLRRYHWMHHRYPGKNFNVVLPLADFVWRTHMKPTPKDIEKMKELGF